MYSTNISQASVIVLSWLQTQVNNENNQTFNNLSVCSQCGLASKITASIIIILQAFSSQTAFLVRFISLVHLLEVFLPKSLLKQQAIAQGHALLSCVIHLQIHQFLNKPQLPICKFSPFLH